MRELVHLLEKRPREKWTRDSHEQQGGRSLGVIFEDPEPVFNNQSAVDPKDRSALGFE